eukprot:TRINITY_DN70549_c0_g1_i1.p1 TRINITY_DN70549_c0_g1~~TRINITY_DN70549_c0_g1_i1.p1  ORF type:complete len:482 (-),score=67.97 TRINITY_DN70549_c0_g1_i1:136-1581(-)
MNAASGPPQNVEPTNIETDPELVQKAATRKAFLRSWPVEWPEEGTPYWLRPICEVLVVSAALYEPRRVFVRAQVGIRVKRTPTAERAALDPQWNLAYDIALTPEPVDDGKWGTTALLELCLVQAGAVWDTDLGVARVPLGLLPLDTSLPMTVELVHPKTRLPIGASVHVVLRIRGLQFRDAPIPRYEILAGNYMGNAVRVWLPGGADIVTETGSLVAMGPDVFLHKVGMVSDSLPTSAASTFLSKEKLFDATYRSERPRDDPDFPETFIELAADIPGGMAVAELDGTPDSRVVLSPGAWVFTSGVIRLNLPSGESIKRHKLDLWSMGLRLMEGVGIVGLGGYGSVLRRELSIGEQFVVEGDNLTAWQHKLSLTWAVVGRSASDSLVSDDLWLALFEGPGVLWYQTRTEDAFRERSLRQRLQAKALQSIPAKFGVRHREVTRKHQQHEEDLNHPSAPKPRGDPSLHQSDSLRLDCAGAFSGM